MKKVLLYTTLTLISAIIVSSIVFAGNNVPLLYNVIPDTLNGYVIDSAVQNQISFTLFENEEALYYSGDALNVVDNHFSIDTSNLVGKHDFTITNSLNETATFTYYFSDENGYVAGYSMDDLDEMNLKTYVKTIKGVKVIYTEKETDVLKDIEEIILSLPDKMLANTHEIKLVPFEHSSNAAGITRYDKITFYNVSKYTKATLKNIVIHEIAHTWAYELMKDKAIDYSYTDYKEVVKMDKRYPSNYARRNVEAGDYSEDFAESISFYFINKDSFTRKYNSRAQYIGNLVDTYLSNTIAEVQN